MEAALWEVQVEMKSCRQRHSSLTNNEAQQYALELADVKIYNGGVYHGISVADWV